MKLFATTVNNWKRMKARILSNLGVLATINLTMITIHSAQRKTAAALDILLQTTNGVSMVIHLEIKSIGSTPEAKIFAPNFGISESTPVPIPNVIAVSFGRQ